MFGKRQNPNALKPPPIAHSESQAQEVLRVWANAWQSTATHASYNLEGPWSLGLAASRRLPDTLQMHTKMRVVIRRSYWRVYVRCLMPKCLSRQTRLKRSNSWLSLTVRPNKSLQVSRDCSALKIKD